jgi:hypothetical protein
MWFEQTKNLPEQGASGTSYLVLSGLDMQGDDKGLLVGGIVVTDEVVVVTVGVVMLDDVELELNKVTSVDEIPIDELGVKVEIKVLMLNGVVGEVGLELLMGELSNVDNGLLVVELLVETVVLSIVVEKVDWLEDDEDDVVVEDESDELIILVVMYSNVLIADEESVDT